MLGILTGGLGGGLGGGGSGGEGLGVDSEGCCKWKYVTQGHYNSVRYSLSCERHAFAVSLKTQNELNCGWPASQHDNGGEGLGPAVRGM